MQATTKSQAGHTADKQLFNAAGVLLHSSLHRMKLAMRSASYAAPWNPEWWRHFTATQNQRFFTF